MSEAMTDVLAVVQAGSAQIQDLGPDVTKYARNLIEQVYVALRDCEDMLRGAGEMIMGGFLDGLNDGFERVMQYVSQIGPWIQENKGPERYDRGLLVDNGGWIMSGLQEGLERSFEGNVMPYVSDMGEMMQRAFGAPVLSPMASVLNRPTQTTQLNQQQSKNLTVILELDRVQVGRMIYNLNNEETQRVGVRLDGGAA
jgi:phage-related protein